MSKVHSREGLLRFCLNSAAGSEPVRGGGNSGFMVIVADQKGRRCPLKVVSMGKVIRFPPVHAKLLVNNPRGKTRRCYLFLMVA